MDIINNTTKILGDDLKTEITYGSKIRIAASCFSIYAYEALKNELNSISELEFIFTNPSVLDEQVKDSIGKENKEFFISKISKINDLIGNEFEIKLRNKLTQKVVAKECADWIKEKAHIKAVIEKIIVQTIINIENDDRKINYTPVDGFTTTDIGYEKNSNKLLGIIKTDSIEESNFFMNQFDKLWENDNQLKDITDNIIEYLSNCYKENSPEYIYFIILYNLFRNYLNVLNEDYLPNEATGYKESLIWKKLYNFQHDGAVGIINKLEKYNGCILADSVGLGKTFTALAVMEYYSLRNKSILVLCPKRLANNWNTYRGNTKTNIFFKDKIRFDVLYHTDLGRVSGISNGMNLATINWGNYDLVVIDESHNFRNSNTDNKAKENRYDFLMNHIMKDGVKTKVLMLSATPVNNRYNDLKNQLALAYCGDFSILDEKLETSKSVQNIFRNAQKSFNAWSKLPVENRKSSDLLDKLDIDFSILLDSVTIARSRKHIKKYYNTKEIGAFPERLNVISYNCKLTNRTDVISYSHIYTKLLSMNMTVYAPLSKVLPSRIDKYENRYQIELRSENAQRLGSIYKSQANRESGIKKLMTINLLKRLESSVYSFNITLKNIMEKNKKILDIINNFQNGNQTLTIEKEYYEYDKIDNDDDSFSLIKDTLGKKIKVELRDIDVISWKREIEEDIAILYFIQNDILKITPEYDYKLSVLKSLIDRKMQKPINEGNNKILIFSAFADTADYLYRNLSQYVLNKYGLYTAKIVGGNTKNESNDGGNFDTDRILTYFSPLSKEKDLIYKNETNNIDVLIGTDCISEGQNLQDCDICINYDIHWNPVRIVQRFGRIDRIGSKNKYIQLVNFWPDISLDEYINLQKRVSARMTIVNATATADDNILNDQEEMDYRAVQLKQLQAGQLQELEDVDGSITITDLGLNEFHMDMITYMKKYGEPSGIAKGLHAVVPADASKDIERGVIYILRNRNESINIDKQNRLHPYYLIYLKENGEIVYNHLQAKKILDVIRTTCKFKVEPLLDKCKEFNMETKDGYKMDKYSELLVAAIKSIVDVKEEKDLQSLFQNGSEVLYQAEIKNLDDFELIAFIVIK